MTSAGRAVPVRYNGAVARMTFGPVTAARVRRWLTDGGLRRPAPARAGHPEPGDARAAGSPRGRSSRRCTPRSSAPADCRWPTRWCGRAWRRSRRASPCPRTPAARSSSTWAGTPSSSPTGCGWTGSAGTDPDPRWTGTPDAPDHRVPRPARRVAQGPAGAARGGARGPARARPGARFLVAGRGETGPDEVRELLGDDARAVEFLGGITDDEKAALLRSVDVYCAPQTGGESFGIVLVEAMSAGAAVVASDLGAFRRVLDEGTAGTLFRTGDPADLAGDARCACSTTTSCAERGARPRLRRRRAVRLVARHPRGAHRVRDGPGGQRPARRGGPDLPARRPRPARAQPTGGSADEAAPSGRCSSARSWPCCCWARLGRGVPDRPAAPQGRRVARDPRDPAGAAGHGRGRARVLGRPRPGELGARGRGGVRGAGRAATTTPAG